MSKASRKGKPRTSPTPLTTRSKDLWPALGPIILVVVTLACYWVPMTSDHTSILWDAADYYRVVQNFFSQELHEGRLPFWAPYPWSGYPFLADPQVGAWYPLNWPFFVFGVSPHALVAEHWLHSLLASLGVYFLALRLVRHRQAAVLAGLCYGLSGFYVGHSSHTTMLQCAAWAPWLMISLYRGSESHAFRHTLLGGLAAGMMILAGHFQTILYSFLSLGLFAVALAVRQPRRGLPVLGMALAIPMLGTLISALGTAPGLELAMNSVRASLAAIDHTEGFIPFSALATLFVPDFYGVFSGKYHGPDDITQFYFYAGILVVPLAVFGVLRRASVRWMGLLLIVPTIWYAMGRPAGLYLVLGRLPGFSSVRAPVNIWFVPALGLALLAGAGMAALCERWSAPWLPAAVLVIASIDLIYFQSATNPLAYSREAYDTLYGPGEDLFRRAVVSQLPPLTRFDAIEHLPTFGPMSHFFSERTEVTYGYGPMPLRRYSDYAAAMATNPKLRNGINVSLWLDPNAGAVRRNPDALPRANFPKRLVGVQSMEESRRRLSTLNQSQEALVLSTVSVQKQDGNGAAEVREFSGGHYRIHYKCTSPSLLRVGNAYFNGWTAQTGGRSLDVVPVDHALMGVVVPVGEGDLDLDYHSTYFVPSLTVSLCSLLASVALLLWLRPKHISAPGRTEV
jgi:hypothetical protein